MKQLFKRRFLTAPALSAAIVVALWLGFCGPAPADTFDRKATDEKVTKYFEAHYKYADLFASFRKAKRRNDPELDKFGSQRQSYVSANRDVLFKGSYENLRPAIRVYTENPVDDAGFRSLVFVGINSQYTLDEKALMSSAEGRKILEALPGNEEILPINQRAFEWLKQHHVNRADLWRYFYSIYAYREVSEAQLAFFEAVAKHNPSAYVRGAFSLKLMDIYSRRIKLDDVAAADREKAQRQREQHYRNVMKQYSAITLSEPGSNEPLGKRAAERWKIISFVGKPAPAIEMPTLDGKADSLSAYRGKVVLLDFWATWCSPCVAGIPKVAAFKEEMAGRPFEVIAISQDDSAEEVYDFMEDNALPFVNWLGGPEHAVYSDYYIDGIPYYVLIDADGVVQSLEYFGENVKFLARQLVEAVEARAVKNGASTR